MFVHLAIHHPKPEHADELLASMRRLVGLALWECEQPPDVLHLTRP